MKPQDIVYAVIADDDSEGVTVTVVITESDEGTKVNENGTTESYTVVLDGQPSDNVYVTATIDSQIRIRTDDGIYAQPGGALTLTFTSVNWESTQTVTVEAVNDSYKEDTTYTSTITHASVSADGSYNGIDVADVVVTVTDNDRSRTGIRDRAIYGYRPTIRGRYRPIVEQ